MVKYMAEDEINMPYYNDRFTGLGICVDGLYGNKVEETSYKFDGANYKYTMKFTMYDIFGLDSNDITDRYVDYAPPFGMLAGFRSWYIMQHYDKYGGDYQPFITMMEFEKTFEGSI